MRIQGRSHPRHSAGRANGVRGRERIQTLQARIHLARQLLHSGTSSLTRASANGHYMKQGWTAMSSPAWCDRRPRIRHCILHLQALCLWPLQGLRRLNWRGRTPWVGDSPIEWRRCVAMGGGGVREVTNGAIRFR
ncbi:hypothetical protein FA13DRAFT_988769 [Coprinellus micaceus]|uniref:Uncharacterized protein n=1 Tax=Coprinellus micaceus TaxID=71717 RepID=A0A4Y7RSE5_COPMI|nr:hypothetical protein FA13DRAFT_988769 [Coprinellus micaceus]